MTQMTSTPGPTPRSPMRVLKWTVVAVLGLVVLAAIALAIFVATFDAARYKPLAIDWVKSRYDRTLAIDGPIELSVFPRLALSVKDVRLSEPGRADTFAQVAAADVALELMPLLRREVRASRITARGVSLVYTRNAAGKSSVDDLLSSPSSATPAAVPDATPAGLPDIDIAGIDLQDVVLRVKDDLAGTAGTLTLARLKAGRIAAGVETAVELKARVDFTQPAVQGDVEGNTRVSLRVPGLGVGVGAGAGAGAGVPGGAGAADAGGKAASIAIGATRVAFSGTAAGVKFGKAEIGFAGTQQVPAERRVDVQGLTLALDVTPAGLGAQSIQLEGTASGSPRQLAWNLAGKWSAPGNAGPVSTRGSFAPDSGVVNAVVQLASLDVDALRNAGGGRKAAAVSVPVNASTGSASGAKSSEATAATPKATTTPTAATSSTLSSDTPVDLSVAAALKGTVEASVGTLVANRIRFSDMRVVLKGDGRTLDAAPFAAKVWGGQINGTARVQPAANRLQLTAAATGIRIEQAMKDVSGRDTVHGTGRLDLALDTTGKTVDQFKQQLAGKASVQLRDAAVKGFNLAALGRQAKAALAQNRDAVEQARATEQTDFSEITASFAIANGVARSSDLAAKSPYLRVTGDGAVDIARSRIDYTAFVTVTDTSKGQGGAELAALEGVRVPVRLTGPLDAVQYQVQWSAVGTSIAKEAVKAKLAEKLGVDPSASGATAKEKLREKAREKLKGLFK